VHSVNSIASTRAGQPPPGRPPPRRSPRAAVTWVRPLLGSLVLLRFQVTCIRSSIVVEVRPRPYIQTLNAIWLLLVVVAYFVIGLVWARPRSARVLDRAPGERWIAGEHLCGARHPSWFWLFLCRALGPSSAFINVFLRVTAPCQARSCTPCSASEAETEPSDGELGGAEALLPPTEGDRNAMEEVIPPEPLRFLGRHRHEDSDAPGRGFAASAAFAASSPPALRSRAHRDGSSGKCRAPLCRPSRTAWASSPVAREWLRP